MNDNELLIRYAPQGIVVIDETHTVTIWNDTATHILGWERAEIVGRPLLILTADEGELHTAFDQVHTTHRRASFRYRTQNRAGERIYLHLAIAPFPSQSNNHTILVFDDVTRQVVSQGQLEQRARDRSRRLQAVYELVETTSTSSSVGVGDDDLLFDTSLGRIMKATHANGGALHQLDDSGTQLHLIAHAGLANEIVAKTQVMAADAGLSGWSVINDEPLVLDDVNADWRTSQLIRNSDLTVYAGFPITAGEQVVGVLSLFRERKRPFGQEDIALIRAVADQIGIALNNQQLREMNERLLLVEERTRLARELHDAVTQSLYSGTLMTAALTKQLQLEQWHIAQQIADQLQQTSQQALKEMRLLIHNLRPSALASVGLVEAIRYRLDAVEGRAGISHRLLITGEIDLPDTIETMLYYIAQEALNNALKHGGGTSVTVQFTQTTDKITMQITDNGMGFNLDQVDNGGLGLTSMQERTDQIGAILTIDSDEEETAVIVNCSLS